MKDQENNISPEQPNENSRNPKEDIPLWLQGLEEETKANRIQAAKEILMGANEETQASMNSDTSPDSDDENEPFSENIEEEQADFVLIEDIPQDSAVFESLQEPSETLEPVSEELAVLEDSPKSDDELQEGLLTTDTIEGTVEPLETLPDTPDTDEEGQSQETDTSEDLAPVDPISELPEPVVPMEPSSDELVTEEETNEVDDTEKISSLTSDHLNDEADNLEWVNEITELDLETSNFAEDHTKPQNIVEVDQQHLENELGNSAPEPAPFTDKEPFIDISELNADDDHEDLAYDKEKEEPASGIIDIIQESEDSSFIENKILSDNEESSFLEGDSSPMDENLAFDEEEALPDDEELPKWLQRLIAESYPDENFDQPTPLAEDALNEITKPVVLTPPQTPAHDLGEIEGLESFDDFEEFEDFEEVLEPDVSSLAEDLDDPGESPEQGAPQIEAAFPSEDTALDFDLDTFESDEEVSSVDEAPSSEEAGFGVFIDEDTQPVKVMEEKLEEIPIVIEEPIEWTEEDNLYFNPENGYLIEIPEPLQFAKQVLKHGDITQGLDIIRTYITDDRFLDEIKAWLLEAAELRMESQTDIWEAIGDIAANQEKHREALAAYSKAINYLLSTKD